MLRRRVLSAVTLGAAALVAACTTTYGVEPGPSGADASPDSDARPGTSDGAAPKDDGSVTHSDATTSSDGASDAAAYQEPCPPCPPGSTCIAAGCTGDGTYNACSAPYDVDAPMTVIAFVCPESPTVDFPQACVPGGATKGLHVAVFRMGLSGGTKDGWKVSATGSNTFVSSGDCTMVTSCSGGTNGPSQPRAVDALATVMIGTTNPLTTCQQIRIEIASN